MLMEGVSRDTASSEILPKYTYIFKKENNKPIKGIKRTLLV